MIQLSINRSPSSRCARSAVSLGALLFFGCSAEDGERQPAGPDPFANAAGNGASTGSGGAFGNPQAPVGMGGPATPGVPATGAPGTTCAQGVANTAPVTPTVWLVLDGSGSMDDEFENGNSRWNVLRSALMDGGGLVARLEQGVRFGMVIYSGIDQDPDQSQDPNQDPNQPAPMPVGVDGCVQLVTVPPALNNFATIDAQFPQRELGGWTPTDRAIEHVVDTLPVVNQEVLDQQNDPIYVILATDGAPNNRCGVDNNNRGSSGLDPEVATRVIAAVDRGVQAGMTMFIVSLAGGDMELQSHLEEVATVTATGRAPFVPATRDDLIATLQEIIGNATCQITLNGSVATGQECSGSVTLNGDPLACNAENGWRLLDASTVQLTGSACDSFLATASQIHASFPCGAFTVE